jgi:hypothetical protein
MKEQIHLHQKSNSRSTWNWDDSFRRGRARPWDLWKVILARRSSSCRPGRSSSSESESTSERDSMEEVSLNGFSPSADVSDPLKSASRTDLGSCVGGVHTGITRGFAGAISPNLGHGRRAISSSHSPDVGSGGKRASERARGRIFNRRLVEAEVVSQLHRGRLAGGRVFSA